MPGTSRYWNLRLKRSSPAKIPSWITWTSSVSSGRQQKKTSMKSWRRFYGRCWYNEKGVDGAILKKANLVALRLGMGDVKVSNRWLNCFKKCNKIVYSCSCGESLTVDASTVQKWMELLPELIASYKPSDIFNADESASSTICSRNKHGPSRVTAVTMENTVRSACCHCSVQTRMGLKSCLCSWLQNLQNPGASRTCGCCHATTILTKRHGWLTNILQQLDCKVGAKARNILLFVDNASCHRWSHLGTWPAWGMS